MQYLCFKFAMQCTEFLVYNAVQPIYVSFMSIAVYLSIFYMFSYTNVETRWDYNNSFSTGSIRSSYPCKRFQLNVNLFFLLPGFVFDL